MEEELVPFFKVRDNDTADANDLWWENGRHQPYFLFDYYTEEKVW